jgi:hypothetical protein
LSLTSAKKEEKKGRNLLSFVVVVCVCVCVCVWMEEEREKGNLFFSICVSAKERETDRQTDRQTDRSCFSQFCSFK